MSEHVFELDSVVLSAGSTRILRSVTAAIPRGSRMMIAGDNGSGKTTLLKVMLGLIRPNRGRVLLFGNPIGSIGWKKARRDVAYVHQESVEVEFPISAEEVVSIGVAASRKNSSERKRIVAESMQQTGCSRIAGRSYRVLSGGEKQRASIARCLSQNASVLLLDEPCASLDPQTGNEIIELIESLNQDRGITIVMVTHDTRRFERPGWRMYTMSNGMLEG